MKFREPKQFLSFCLVGLLNTAIGYSVYCIVVYFGFHYLLANVMSFLFGVLNAFYWSDKFVFKLQDGQHRNRKYTLLKTFLSYGATGLLFNSLILIALIESLDFSKYVAQIIGILGRVPLNFALNKYWAYK